MIAIKHFRELIVRPVLDQLKLYSLNREELLVITCAQESLGGTYLMQNGTRGYPDGPALGIYQMEPVTYRDLFNNFLKYRTILYQRLMSVLYEEILYVPQSERLIYDLRYATACAAYQYYRFAEAIPDDLDGQVRYYKKYWNTDLGKATLTETRKNYDYFVNQ